MPACRSRQVLPHQLQIPRPDPPPDCPGGSTGSSRPLRSAARQGRSAPGAGPSYGLPGQSGTLSRGSAVRRRVSIYLRIQAVIDNLSQHYITSYDDRRQIDGQRVNATVNGKVIRNLALDMAGKSLLDVGSGNGCFLSHARKAGAQRAICIELSDAERKYSAEILRLEAYSNISDLGKNTQFDIITIFEVIEHIPEPYEFIRTIITYLKTGGSLVIGLTISNPML